MKPGLLLFDFDGTLVDTAPDIAYHANDVLDRRGLGRHSLEAVQGGVGWGVHELLRSLTPGHPWTDAGLDEAVAEFKRLYGERPVIETRPYPAVREMLTGPLAAFPKAILTNKPHSLTVAILRELDLEKYFYEVLGEGKGFPRKPEPAGAEYLMRKAGVPADRTVLVGDSQVDRETAQRTGMGFVWMDYGYDRRLENDRTVKRLSSAADWGKLWGG